MRVCIRKSDGRIIESQSGDNAPLDVLFINALAAGYNSDDVIVKIIPDKEFEDILAEQHQLSLSYYNKRAANYPPIGDQLDALFKAGLFPPDMAAKIQSVKDKYPKDSA